MFRRHRAAAVLAGTVALLAAAVTAPARAASGTATVTVVHGVPGATVDVYANGEELLTDFEPGTVTDPTELPAGTYDLKVTEAGAGADGEALIEANGVEVPAGKARLTVRHTAAAPAVDVRAGGTPVFEGLTNPNEESAEVDAGTVNADVVLAGTETVALGPAVLTLEEGTNTIVYAWGSAADENLDLAVQTISGLDSAPAGVPSGTGGQAAASEAMPVWLAAVFALALVGLVASAGTLATARVRSRR